MHNLEKAIKKLRTPVVVTVYRYSRIGTPHNSKRQTLGNLQNMCLISKSSEHILALKILCNKIVMFTVYLNNAVD